MKALSFFRKVRFHALMEKVIIKIDVSDRKRRDIFRSDPVLQSGSLQEHIVLICKTVHFSSPDPQALIVSELANVVLIQPSVGQLVGL